MRQRTFATSFTGRLVSSSHSMASSPCGGFTSLANTTFTLTGGDHLLCRSRDLDFRRILHEHHDRLRGHALPWGIRVRLEDVFKIGFRVGEQPVRAVHLRTAATSRRNAGRRWRRRFLKHFRKPLVQTFVLEIRRLHFAPIPKRFGLKVEAASCRLFDAAGSRIYGFGISSSSITHGASMSLPPRLVSPPASVLPFPMIAQHSQFTNCSSQMCVTTRVVSPGYADSWPSAKEGLPPCAVVKHGLSHGALFPELAHTLLAA